MILDEHVNLYDGYSMMNLRNKTANFTIWRLASLTTGLEFFVYFECKLPPSMVTDEKMLVVHLGQD